MPDCMQLTVSVPITRSVRAMRTIATGGLAPLFAGATEAIERVDPDLTLWGLRLIYDYNSTR